MGECATFHVQTELVVLCRVGGHNLGEHRLGPRLAFAVHEHLALFQVVCEAVENCGKVLLREVAHNLEDALAHHAEESFLVVGDVSGGLVSTEGLLCLVFCRARFQSLLVVLGVGHLFPFLQQARVGAAYHVAEVVFHLVEFVILVAVGHRLAQNLIYVVEVPEQNRFHALQAVLLHVAAEGAEVLEHLAHDALGFHVHVDPRVLFRKLVVRAVDKLAERLGVLDLLDFFHALVVFHALRLEFVEPCGARLVLLDAQNRLRVLYDAFAQRNHVERVFRAFAVQFRERIYQVERERLVHREVVLQVHVHAQVTVALGYGLHELHDVLFHQASEKLEGAVLQLLLARCTLVAVLDERAHRLAAVGLAAQDIQEHPVVYAEARGERFGLRVDQAPVRALVEGNVAVLGRFALLELLSGLAALRLEFQVLDYMFGSLRHHVSDVVESLAPCAARNLVEVACG